MAYTPRDNSGSLFKNEEKQQDNHADYEGSAMINGEEFWISAWIKRPEGKKSFMSLAFKPKNKSRQQRREQPQERKSHAAPPPPGMGARATNEQDPQTGDYRW